MEIRLKLENTQKVPIVVPKVAFLGTFGTTIGLLANETYYHALSRLQYMYEIKSFSCDGA